MMMCVDGFNVWEGKGGGNIFGGVDVLGWEWCFFDVILHMHHICLTHDADVLAGMPLVQVIARFLCCRYRHSAQVGLRDLEPERSEGSSPETPASLSSPASSAATTEARGDLVFTGIIRASRAEEQFEGLVGLAPSQEIIDHPDSRFYAVWQIPGAGDTEVAGIHYSIGDSAYCSIIYLNRGQFRGIAFRRYPDLAAAQAAFRAEAHVHRLQAILANRLVQWRYAPQNRA